MTEPTIETLIQNAISVYENEAKTKLPFKKGFEFFLLSATAGLAKLCLKYGQLLFKNSFVHLADQDGIQRFASEYGLKKHKPQSAHIKIAVSNLIVPSVPVSTHFRVANYMFVSLSTVDVENGAATIETVSEKTGFLKDLQLGQEAEIVETLSLSQKAQISEILSLGLEEETDEHFQKRLLNIIQNKGPTGTQPYYLRKSLEVFGLEEVFVFRGSEPFEIAIYPLFKERSSGNPEEKRRLLSHLKNPKIAVQGDVLSLKDFKRIKVVIKIANLAPSHRSIQDKITTVITEFVHSRRPKQHPMQFYSPDSLTTMDIYNLLEPFKLRNAFISFSVNGKNLNIYTLKGLESSYAEIFDIQEVSFV